VADDELRLHEAGPETSNLDQIGGRNQPKRADFSATPNPICAQAGKSLDRLLSVSVAVSRSKPLADQDLYLVNLRLLRQQGCLVGGVRC
jgi:hypothetical protein